MNNNLKIEELADNIWRVRMARDGRWPESAMNRDGECALTEITCKDGKVEIGERVGTYDGMPEKRAFTIVRECIEE